MIKIKYNNNSINIKDINTYLKSENYHDNSINIKDRNIHLKIENYHDMSVNVKDINTYLKMERDYDDINYIYQTYDQYHVEYRRIIELFDFGLGA